LSQNSNVLWGHDVPKAKLRLDQNLILNNFFLNLFGKNKFQDLQKILSDVTEGYDEEDKSYYYYTISSQKDIKISAEELELYDANIKEYVDAINKGGEEKINLKYFQYLAVLFTEIFLDKYFRNPVAFLKELNNFVENHEFDESFLFDRDNLPKLAFWMATGSGKTIILLINYLQFMRYNKGKHKIDYDNLILITPSEMLTTQHMKKLKECNIPCEIFESNHSGYFSNFERSNKLKLIDIHKFKEEKGRATIAVEEFGTKNIIFVDEGHKGSGGKKWKEFREIVSQEGFTFEYSATFGQAISASGNNSSKLLEEYGRCIIFDYSYKYFYNDRYGKEYRIMNLKDKDYSEITRKRLMIANLLTFFEQLKLYEDSIADVERYQIEKPLWVFVGSSVTAKRGSDVKEIILFLDSVLRNNNDEIVSLIDKIVKGNSGLIDDFDRDIFSPSYPEKRLSYLRELELSASDIYKEVLEKIFYASHKTPLILSNLKNATGEIGLKAGNSDYFGVINIGNETQFLNLIKEETKIQFTPPDQMSPSLFDSVNDRSSKINVLIGAKKFIEGWDSWRVSNMGLFNIGKSEGSQIIQLFGRGVRLKGKENSLKRSSGTDLSAPENLLILETLNIFGIMANYMEKFRDYLEAEGIPLYASVEIKLPIEINQEYLKKGLLIPKINPSDFPKEEYLELDIDDKIHVTIDLMPHVEIVASLSPDGVQATTKIPLRTIEKKYLDILDWNKIYYEILGYKSQRGWNNLVIQRDTLRNFIENDQYAILCPKERITPSSYEGIALIEDTVIMILKKYVSVWYVKKKNSWLQENMELELLTGIHNNVNFNNYYLFIREDKKDLIKTIEELIENNIEEVRKNFYENGIKNVYFDRHLYQPLLSESNEVQMSPVGLNEGERTFIEDLRKYFKKNADQFVDKEIYVLRNQPKRGIGFFETSFFYPDFILWIKEIDMQHIVFIDPKGLSRMHKGIEEEKVQLFNKIKDLEEKLSYDYNINLHSFIISVTPYKDAKGLFNSKRREDLEKHNIFFQKDDPKYIEKMFEAINQDLFP